MESLEDFFHDFQQRVLHAADAIEDFAESQFTELMASYLEDAGEAEAFSCEFARDPGNRWRADGYSWDEVTGTFSLLVTDYRPQDALQTLTTTDVKTFFAKGIRFLERSLSPQFLKSLEETSAAYGVGSMIKALRPEVFRFKVFLLSNAKLSDRFSDVESGEVDGVPVSLHVWDISRVMRLETAKQEREDLVVDFLDEYGQRLPCLPAVSDTAGYQSYLVVMPGELLANLYGRWGSRLLEQNVRSFLQARGKVNQGIRRTILEEPSMFFAYNNGITATAEDLVVESEGSGHFIRSIRNMQIVNGGQTTASLFNVLKKDRADLGHIAVQMKLSIVSPSEATTIVPRISRYANSQNKVNEADFFSNHPFHIRVEEFSRKLWAPPVAGAQRDTKWFYERARGQYLDAQAHLTGAQKRKFRQEYPRHQMFTKTDLAKFENVWRDMPHVVSMGAQKNFARFAEHTAPAWEKDSATFNEHYYKCLIAKAIIFRHTEKLVTEQPWYQGGYRANVVAYTLSWVAHHVRLRGKTIDFLAIWNRQEVDDAFKEALKRVAKAVHDRITDTPSNISNVTEWCKKEACWARVREIEIDVPDLESGLVDLAEARADAEDAKKLQKIDDGIHAQRVVLEKGASYWRELADKLAAAGELTDREASILRVASTPGKLPSEKQAIALLHIEAKITS